MESLFDDALLRQRLRTLVVGTRASLADSLPDVQMDSAVSLPFELGWFILPKAH